MIEHIELSYMRRDKQIMTGLEKQSNIEQNEEGVIDACHIFYTFRG